MTAFEWFTTEIVGLAVVAFLNVIEVIETEMWFPRWLTDGVPDLPDAERF